MAATLVDRIRGDLLHRFAGGERPDLRLATLAGHYGTSTRPVRLALDLLAAEGVIARDDGRGWRIARAPKRASAPPPADDAAERLQDLLVRRAVAGDESFLREDDACARLRIGRGRLRALLERAAGVGLAVHEPRRGWRARALTQADLDQFIAVRMTLELLALDLALPRLEDAVLAEYETANAEGSGDNRLHGYLVERAGNRYIADFFARHAPFFERLFEWEGRDARTHAQTRRQHLAVLRALRARDRDAARAALAEHIGGNNPVLRQLVAR